MMPTIRRLTDSCLVVTTDDGATLIDPGFHTFDTGEIELDSIGDIRRVLVTHEHGDHVNPAFVRWLLDRGEDVTVHANQAVVDLLAEHEIAASSLPPRRRVAARRTSSMSGFPREPSLQTGAGRSTT